MAQEEVKQTIYIAIGLIIAAAVLTLLSFVIHVRSDYATAYNENKMREAESQAYSSLIGYNGKIITGGELAAMIREYWNSDITICIDELVFQDMNKNKINTPYKGMTGTLKDTIPVNIGGTNKDYIFLTPNYTRMVTKYIQNRPNPEDIPSSNLVYSYSDLTTGRTVTPFVLSGETTNGLYFEEPYYVYLVDDAISYDEIVSANFKDTIKYSEVNAIRVVHSAPCALLIGNQLVFQAGDMSESTPSAIYRDFDNVIKNPYAWNNNTSITSINFDVNTHFKIGSNGVFEGMTNLKTITGMRLMDVSNSTSLNKMFSNCQKLEAIDMGSFKTYEVTSMYRTFYNCKALTTLDVTNLNTSQVTNMQEMFRACTGLTSLDLSGFDTSKVTNMSGMFRGCSNLTEINMSGWNMNNVTNNANMFTGVPTGVTIFVTSQATFDTIKAINPSANVVLTFIG